MKKIIIYCLFCLSALIFNNAFASSSVEKQSEKNFLTQIKNIEYTTQKYVFHDFVLQPMNDGEALKAIASVVDKSYFHKKLLFICNNIQGCFVQYPQESF